MHQTWPCKKLSWVQLLYTTISLIEKEAYYGQICEQLKSWGVTRTVQKRSRIQNDLDKLESLSEISKIKVHTKVESSIYMEEKSHAYTCKIREGIWNVSQPEDQWTR